MNGQKRCYNCMRILEEEKHQEICPWCGFEEKKRKISDWQKA